jgi:hypothetical protein
MQEQSKVYGSGQQEFYISFMVEVTIDPFIKPILLGTFLNKKFSHLFRGKVIMVDVFFI